MAGLQINDKYSELAVAVSFALAVLRKTKQSDWATLLTALEDEDLDVVKAMKTIDLEDTELALMDEHAHVLGLISLSPTMVTVACCPECSRFVLVSDSAPSGCQVTLNCPGKPYRVVAAKAAKPGEKPEPAAAEAESTEPPAEPVSEPEEAPAAEPEEAGEPDEIVDFDFDAEPAPSREPVAAGVAALYDDDDGFD